MTLFNDKNFLEGLLLWIKNIILPPRTSLGPPLGPNDPLPHRSTKSPQHILPTNIHSKLSTRAPLLRRALQHSMNPCLGTQALGNPHPRLQISDIPIHALELGLDFPFKEMLELDTDDGLDKGVEECGKNVVLGLLEGVGEVVDRDGDFVHLEERVVVRGGQIRGQFDFCGNALLVHLLLAESLDERIRKRQEDLCLGIEGIQSS